MRIELGDMTLRLVMVWMYFLFWTASVKGDVIRVLAPNGDIVLVETKCFNCTQSCCGDNCKCFGGQYYCADGKCPIAQQKSVVPVVTTPQPFRNQGLWGYNSNHTCPNCHYTSPPRTGTWVVSGSGPNGTHTHTCPRCGTSWYH